MANQTKAFDDLVRGVTVIVGETFSDEELHGTKMKIASKGVVKCNGGKRCADDSTCVGLALFVTDPESFNPEPDGSTGWRHNTTKICLTHLKDGKGKSLLSGKRSKTALAATEPEAQEAQEVPEETEETEIAKKPRRRRRALAKASDGDRAMDTLTLPPPVIEEVPSHEQIVPMAATTVTLRIESDENIITMQDVADAINNKDIGRMKGFILTLKDENEGLRRQLNAVQQLLLTRLLEQA